MTEEEITDLCAQLEALRDDGIINKLFAPRRPILTAAIETILANREYLVDAIQHERALDAAEEAREQGYDDRHRRSYGSPR